MKPKSNLLLLSSNLALIAFTLVTLPATAGTTWDGGGADTQLGTGANWNIDDLAPLFDGTQNVTFSTAGTTATVSPAGNIDFNSITLNQTDGFTIQAGTGTLRIKGTTGSSTTNGHITTAGTNAMAITAPIVVNTAGAFLNLNNSNSASTGLALSGGLSASSGSYSLRLGGNGKTVISGTVTGVSGIQQSNSSPFSGTVVFDCNLSATGALNIATTTSGSVTTPKIQMGTSTSQTQSWTTCAINQNATIIVNSNATMTALDIATAGSNGSSGATMEVAGSLTGTTLKIGSSAYTGILKVSGTASFSGALTTGSLAGSKIVGNAASNGTLKLSSGTNLGGSSSSIIGGGGTNENNLNLEKISSGTLTLTGTHSYAGTTTVTAGILDISAASLSGTSAVNVSSSGTLGLSVSTPTTVPGTTNFSSGSKVKVSGTAADGAILMTANGGMSGTAPVIDPSISGFITEISGNQLKLKLGSLPSALNTWDAGGGVDTNINTASNWGFDTLPTSGASVIFADAGAAANVNVDTQFAAVTLNRAAAFNIQGASNLILSSVNSSTSSNLVLGNTAGGTQSIDAPLQIDTTNTTNKLFSLANNSTSRTLDINGPISRSASSTADFGLRFQNTAGSITRIDGATSNLGSVQQSFAGVVAGDLIFGGSRSGSASITIATAATGVTPASTARLYLGESPSDAQTWGNINLSNTIKLVVGGNITAGTFTAAGAATAANTRVVGNSSTNSTLSLTGGDINNLVTIGGPGTNENNLNLVKADAGNLSISGGTHTYTGGTTINGGTLTIAPTVTLPSSITVNASGTLAGEGGTSGTLTFGTGNTTVTFDPATSGSFTAGSVNLTGAGSIYLSPSSATTIGTPYVVLTRNTGTFSPADLTKFIPATRGTVSITGAGAEITLTPSGTASVVWKGNAANPTFWDAAITQNWTKDAITDRFYTGDNVTFDDTASSFTVDVQGVSITPGDMLFNNSTSNPYTIGGGIIGGGGSFTKTGSGTVTLTQTGINTFSGTLAINAGTLSISNINQIGGSSSTRAIGLGGGTLQYTYATTAAQTSNTLPVSLNSGTSTIDITGSVPSGEINNLTLAVTLRLGAPVTGSGNLVKSGIGILSLGQNSATTLGSTFLGTVLVTGGALDIRNPDALGSTSAGTTISGASLEIFPFGQDAGVTFNAEPLTLSGNSFIRMKNEDSNSDIENIWTGPVTVSPAAVVGISAPKQHTFSNVIANTITSVSPNISKLEISGNVSTGAGSILKLGLIPTGVTAPAVQSDVAQTIEISGPITGSGSIEAQGASTSLYTLTDPEYSGNTTVNGGTLSLGADNSANNASTVNIASSGAKLDLNFAGTDTVNKLFIGGVQQAAGVYTSSHVSGAFSGSGTLTVTSGPSTGYAGWASANGIPGQPASGDFDNDGLDNLTEYALGLNPAASSPSPGVFTGNTITFTKGTTAISNGDVNFIIETSVDLGVTIPWTAAVTQNAPNASTTIGYTFTPGSPAKNFARLRTVLVP